MRKVFAVALTAAMAGAVGLSQSAQAGVSYDYSFRSVDVDGNPIAGGSVSGGGHTFTFTSPSAAAACQSSGAGCPVLDVILRTTDPLFSASVSVTFDNSNGLTYIQSLTNEWAGVGVIFNMAMGSIVDFSPLGGLAFTASSVNNFDGVVIPPNGPPSLPVGTYNIGTVVWDTSGASGGLHGVMTELLQTDSGGTGGVVNGDKVLIPDSSIGTAMGFVNIVPEPATAGLLGLGLTGLVLAGRRRRA